jgi:hypothetical protein
VKLLEKEHLYFLFDLFSSAVSVIKEDHDGYNLLGVLHFPSTSGSFFVIYY